MPHSLRIPKFPCVAGALVLALALPFSARAAGDPSPAGAAASTPVSSFAPQMKRAQRAALLREGAERREVARARASRHGQARVRHVRGAEKLRQPIDLGEPGGPQGTGANRTAVPSAARRAALAPAALDPNVLVNDRTHDNDYSPPIGQCEEMVAAYGQNVLIAFNDGLGFPLFTSTQGFSYSTDGGQTFTDGGFPPALPSMTWTSDPVVVVNEKTGEFWYCALADSADHNGVGVIKATFSGNTLVWGTPVMAVSMVTAAAQADKPWMAVDSLSGRLYLSYSVFTFTGGASDHIAFQRSAAGGGSWESPQTLSAPSEAGMVQGSRPAVGPNGEVYVVWNSIGPVDVDFMRIVRSTSQGAAGSWGAPANAANEFSNFGSGAPGFNRGIGITFPGIAVDRSSGPHRGRVYVSWNECIDFFADPLGTGSTVNEAEANNTQATATPFTLGQTLSGTVTTGDIDYFRFSGTAGQTVILFADTLASNLDLLLRLVAADTTRLALSATGTGATDLVVYTLPRTGQYYVRCTGNHSVSTGFYRIQTGVHVTPNTKDHARDHRDAFVAWSDDAVHWNGPYFASDSPAGYDDWLPEVAVAGNSDDPRTVGEPYCLWYDWRDSPAATCGGVSHVYLSRSDDGGTTWNKVGIVTDQQTAWTNTQSNIAPNQGDYVSLFANASDLYTSWADGRNGDPDVYMSRIPLITTAVDIALVSARATPDSVTVTWFSGLPLGFPATVQRATDGINFEDLGAPTPENGTYLVYVDHAVSPGGRYYYRLQYTPSGTTTPRTTGATLVVVPSRALILLGAQPNPVNEKQGWVVAFELADLSPGKIELFDVAGRKILETTVSGMGPQTVDLSAGRSLKPGLYIIRLSQSGRDAAKRVTIVR